MRFANLIALAASVVFTAPVALACKGIHPDSLPWPKSVFWSDAPLVSDLRPDEVVVRVIFERFAAPGDPDIRKFAAGDIVIIDCNNPPSQVYSVRQSPSEPIIYGPILVHGHSAAIAGRLGEDALKSMDLVLVGRLAPLDPEHADAYATGDDRAWQLLLPRSPP